MFFSKRLIFLHEAFYLLLVAADARRAQLGTIDGFSAMACCGYVLIAAF